MSKYYGITIHSANIVKYGNIKDMSLCDKNSKIEWFVTEESAIRYADKYLRERMVQRAEVPELFEREASNLPGIAFLYMEDKLPPLAESRTPGSIGVGGVDGFKSATFVYCPPPGLDSASTPHGHRPFLYYAGLDTQSIRRIVEAYDKDAEIILPKGYQPHLIPTETSDKPTKYVHYGNTTFDNRTFEPVSARTHNIKPDAGFWASATDAKYSWRNLCQDRKYRNDGPNCRLEFTLKPEAKVFQVRTQDDIAFLLKNYSMPLTSDILTAGTYIERDMFPCLAIDFEAMSKDYDGIDYSYSNLGNLMGEWDCDSVCIFNPDIMRFHEIEMIPEDHECIQDALDDIDEDIEW